VAGNVSVAELDPEAVAEGPSRRLADLGAGEVATIRGLSPAIRGRERNRLLDLGFVPGSPVELGFESPFASPSAYRVRGSLIALRREQAEQVFIGPPPESGSGSVLVEGGVA
jgi:DtxR family Mn-dependent transcriptional regulator